MWPDLTATRSSDIGGRSVIQVENLRQSHRLMRTCMHAIKCEPKLADWEVYRTTSQTCSSSSSPGSSRTIYMCNVPEYLHSLFLLLVLFILVNHHCRLLSAKTIESRSLTTSIALQQPVLLNVRLQVGFIYSLQHVCQIWLM